MDSNAFDCLCRAGADGEGVGNPERGCEQPRLPEMRIPRCLDMEVRPIRVVIIDDHRILLDSLEARINSEPELDVVATATTADEGFRYVIEERPDVVILDVEIPGRGAFDVASEIAARYRQTRVIFLTGYLTDVFIEQALRAKASGYLMKGEPLDVLTEAIRRVHRGELCFSPEVESRMKHGRRGIRSVPHSRSRLSLLTPRQLEVLRHLAAGKSVKEVARQMHLSEKSVDSHKYRIMHKLGIHDRVELARYAIREGLTLP